MTRPDRFSWLLLSVTALAFTLAHAFVDFHIGLFGETSIQMTPLQAANVFLYCLVIGWWSSSLAITAGGGRGGFSSAFTLAVGWAFLNNGVVAVLAAPPPSAAFPYQDITHFGSLAFGGLAAYSLWRKMRALAIPFEPRSVIITAGLIIIAVATSGILALSNL